MNSFFNEYGSKNFFLPAPQLANFFGDKNRAPLKYMTRGLRSFRYATVCFGELMIL
jgi:hypothetical protein